ncbi:hypothetical protein C8J56DRAFT_764553, partial [Mycena floridula]
IVLRKPGRGNYALPKSHRPIALYEVIEKSQDAVRAGLLSYVSKEHQLLPATHIGGRPGRTTTDVLHLLVTRAKNEWR